MRTVIDVALERAYWISQVVLAIIATIAAIAAFLQLRTFKLFELLKFLESKDFRDARRVVLREVYPKKDEDWWADSEQGERREEAGSIVCAKYDILGRVMEYDAMERIFPHYGSFYRRHWARSIITNHDALKRFLKHRREAYPDAYRAFSDLAERAEREAGPMPPPKV